MPKSMPDVHTTGRGCPVAALSGIIHQQTVDVLTTDGPTSQGMGGIALYTAAAGVPAGSMELADMPHLVLGRRFVARSWQSPT